MRNRKRSIRLLCYSLRTLPKTGSPGPELWKKYFLKKRSLWQATFVDQRNFSKIKTGKFGRKEENRNDFLVTRFVLVELLQI